MISQRATPFRIILGALAVGALLAQLVIVPQVAAEYAGAYPEVAYLAPPYVTAIVIAIGGFEVALLASWQLLSAAVAGNVSTSRSKRWATVMTASLCFMSLIFAGIFVHAGSVANVGGPPMMFGLLVSLALVPLAFSVRAKALGFLAGNDIKEGGVA